MSRTSIHHLRGDLAQPAQYEAARDKLLKIFAAEPTYVVGRWQSFGDDESSADAALVVDGEQVHWTKLRVSKSYIDSYKWKASCYGREKTVGKPEYDPNDKNEENPRDLTRARARKIAEELGEQDLRESFEKAKREFFRDEAIRAAKAASEERKAAQAEIARLSALLAEACARRDAIDAALVAEVDARLA